MSQTNTDILIALSPEDLGQLEEHARQIYNQFQVAHFQKSKYAADHENLAKKAALAAIAWMEYRAEALTDSGAKGAIERLNERRARGLHI